MGSYSSPRGMRATRKHAPASSTGIRGPPEGTHRQDNARGCTVPVSAEAVLGAALNTRQHELGGESRIAARCRVRGQTVSNLSDKTNAALLVFPGETEATEGKFAEHFRTKTGARTATRCQTKGAASIHTSVSWANLRCRSVSSSEGGSHISSPTDRGRRFGHVSYEERDQPGTKSAPPTPGYANEKPTRESKQAA